MDATIMEIDRVMSPQGILVATNPNPSYSPLFHLLELLKLKLPEGPHQWRKDQTISQLLVKKGFNYKIVSAYYGIIHGIIGVKNPGHLAKSI
jgi:hypothetical protein